MNILVIKLNIKFSVETVYYNLSENDYFCFLDSSLEENKYSKYSYIGFEPVFDIQSKGNKNIFKNIKTGENSEEEGNPLDFLEKILSKNVFFNFKEKSKKISISFFDNSNGQYIKKAENIVKKFPDFKGGFIGYFSYDLKNFIEELPQTCIDDLNLPDLHLIYFKNVLSYSHKEKCWYYINIYNEDENFYKKKFNDVKNIEFVKNIANTAELKIAQKIKFVSEDEIRKRIVQKYILKNINQVNISSNITKRKYSVNLLKAKKYIHNGDIYQVNFTHRFHSKLQVDGHDFYFILRKINAAPFCAYLNFPEVKIASTSPERFLYINKNYIETRPVKGTRPRGKNQKEDQHFKDELNNSLKDRAELNMIVDLERNDLGKFCKYGSVKVKEHAVIEKYARVFHLVSTVTGKIKTGTAFSRILKAVFPGGSITGAPKIRSMQIIDELEKNTRSIYTGSIGYISVDGIADLNIAIRTFIIKNNNFYYNTGGGIVEDSNPDEEYEETLQKGKALEEALRFFKCDNLLKLNKEASPIS